jgi:hypothetical protein
MLSQALAGALAQAHQAAQAMLGDVARNEAVQRGGGLRCTEIQLRVVRQGPVELGHPRRLRVAPRVYQRTSDRRHQRQLLPRQCVTFQVFDPQAAGADDRRHGKARSRRRGRRRLAGGLRRLPPLRHFPGQGIAQGFRDRCPVPGRGGSLQRRQSPAGSLFARCAAQRQVGHDRRTGQLASRHVALYAHRFKVPEPANFTRCIHVPESNTAAAIHSQRQPWRR